MCKNVYFYVNGACRDPMAPPFLFMNDEIIFYVYGANWDLEPPIPYVNY